MTLRVRCCLTGVEVSDDDAFVLDVVAAQRRLRLLEEQAAVLDRLLAQLTGLAPRSLGAQPAGGWAGRCFVSPAVAKALSEGVGADLFVPWAPIRDRRRAKMSNQASLLLYYAKYRRGTGDEVVSQSLLETARLIRSAAAEVRTLRVADWSCDRKVAMGIEGRAAALYWHAFGGLLPSANTFPGRRTRNADDPVNQALNYAYGCLYAEVWRALATAGLDPCLGIVHGADRADPSLVFDLIEEFRAPFADRVVLSLIGRGHTPVVGSSGLVGRRSRAMLSRGFGRMAAGPLRWRGARATLGKILAAQAHELARLFGGERRSYRPFHFRW